jgi:hypothetical protein
MLSKKCRLTKKDQLWVVLHYDCIYNQKGCEGECAYFKPTLMSEIETYIKSLLYLMTQNPQVTRHHIKSAVDNYLHNVHRQGKIQDYRVICDETNNITPNIATIDIIMKPYRSIEFLKLTVAFAFRNP